MLYKRRHTDTMIRRYVSRIAR